MMKGLIFFLAVVSATAAFAHGPLMDAVYTVPHEMDALVKSGHVQGASCSERGIYISHMLGIDLIGWDGRHIAHADAPKHLGDCAYADGKVYGAICLLDAKPTDRTQGLIRVWDEDLKTVLADIPSDVKLDGAVVLDGFFYTSPDMLGRKPHPGCPIRKYRLPDLRLVEARVIDIGYDIFFGTQTIGTDGTDLFLGNYGAPAEANNPNRYDFTRVTTNLEHRANMNFFASEGFGLVPKSVSKRDTPVFFAVRSLGGGIRAWRADPEKNPPRLRIDFFEYADGKLENITRRNPTKE